MHGGEAAAAAAAGAAPRSKRRRVAAESDSDDEDSADGREASEARFIVCSSFFDGGEGEMPPHARALLHVPGGLTMQVRLVADALSRIALPSPACFSCAGLDSRLVAALQLLGVLA